VHTLAVFDPGHFHAALALRDAQPRLTDEVHVYARDGAELEAFLRLVRSFNERARSPTRWKLHVYRGPDCLDRMCAERRGDIAIVAGKNREKMAAIRRLHDNGFAVLADKPWVIDSSGMQMLRQVIAAGPPAIDIMTERHDSANRLQRALIAQRPLFGELRRSSAETAIELKSVHHLSKTVNGAPLRRPPWYFDVAEQGEGITDVTTHLVDLAQWMTADLPGTDILELRGARQWPTEVSRQWFAQITGQAEFPVELGIAAASGKLDYRCNARIDFLCKGIAVSVEALWALAAPAGGGDTHFALARGTAAEVQVRHDAETGFVSEVSVRPVASQAAFEKKLSAALEALESEFPGLSAQARGEGFQVFLPEALRTTHEQHFATVLDHFLDKLDTKESSRQPADELLARYQLLTQAREQTSQ
jgi:predicted dehydrogenase